VSLFTVDSAGMNFRAEWFPPLPEWLSSTHPLG